MRGKYRKLYRWMEVPSELAAADRLCPVARPRALKHAVELERDAGLLQPLHQHHPARRRRRQHAAPAAQLAPLQIQQDRAEWVATG